MTLATHGAALETGLQRGELPEETVRAGNLASKLIKAEAVIRRSSSLHHFWRPGNARNGGE
jgi:hypothetical protein